MTTGQVDGYGPGEIDGIHWDLLLGGVLAVIAAGALICFSRDVSGAAQRWMHAGAALLIVAAVAGCTVTSFYRRYAFLVWWRRGIVLISSLPYLLPKNVIGSSLVAMMAFSGGGARRMFGMTYRLPTGGVVIESNDISRLGEVDVAVDDDCRVYEWDPWRGMWRYKAESLDGLPVERLRIKRTLFGRVEEPREEPEHRLVDF